MAGVLDKRRSENVMLLHDGDKNKPRIEKINTTYKQKPKSENSTQFAPQIATNRKQ